MTVAGARRAAGGLVLAVAGALVVLAAAYRSAALLARSGRAPTDAGERGRIAAASGPAIARSPAKSSAGAESAAGGAPIDWPFTEGAPGGGRYSPLTDIDTTNVGSLRVVWTYRHGDYRSAFPREHRGTAFEATPIVAEGRLIFSTPYNRVIALDPETGTELWTFDPKIPKNRLFANMLISRGVAYWRSAAPGEPCSPRVLVATLDARLIALDAATGRPCQRFGDRGTVNLFEGIEHLEDPWEYNVTSPPTVVGDRVIVGSSIADMVRRIQPSGAVRAYDVRTGRLVWRFNTIPRPGEPGHESWPDGRWAETGGANVWSTITADTARGLVFLPVGAAGPDFYGGDRPGSNLFANSVVALRVSTGEYVWHFQVVHHDLWDYDVAAPPILLRVPHERRERDAVAVLTKTGFVFLLDRDGGSPLFPIEERPVPASDVTGERAWPTQPVPLRPPPLVPQRLTERDLWDRDARRLARCRERLRSLRYEGVFTPPSERGSLLYPYTGGGANWSGGAFDPRTALLYVPVNNLAHTIRLEALSEDNYRTTGGAVLSSPIRALRHVLTGWGPGLRFAMRRELFAERGKPCNAPPWGWLVAVNLARGEIAWREPVGEDGGVRGLPNFGAALVTAGGLVFHGGSADTRLRAHHARTGEVLATFDLPAALHAGPISYRLRPGGQQYLVVAPGGHSVLNTKLGDYVIAYALPE